MENVYMRSFLISAAYEDQAGKPQFLNFIVELDRFPSRASVEKICLEKSENKFLGITSIVEMNIGDAQGWK